MATHCSILAWQITWTEEPGELQSMGSQRVRHARVTNMQKKSFVHIIFSTPRKPGQQRTAVDDHSLSCQRCGRAWLTHSAGH